MFLFFSSENPKGLIWKCLQGCQELVNLSWLRVARFQRRCQNISLCLLAKVQHVCLNLYPQLTFLRYRIVENISRSSHFFVWFLDKDPICYSAYLVNCIEHIDKTIILAVYRVLLETFYRWNFTWNLLNFLNGIIHISFFNCPFSFSGMSRWEFEVGWRTVYVPVRLPWYAH